MSREEAGNLGRMQYIDIVMYALKFNFNEAEV